MKKILIVAFIVSTQLAFAQNVQVDSQSYSPQQLIEDILINSDCIENVVVTNVLGGDFNGSDQSYGYFDASGSNFPFANGLVLSTGRLQNVQGPNTSLSDDDAPNWVGDSDLETILGEPNTLNATLIEFDFTSVASEISFRYIFASEEYQENDPNTCQYSDLFGFLIRPINGQQYTNIALVPNTQTPVKVTTVHPDIPNGCPAINETYFGSFNDASAPINLNGETTILTATATVIPNETYHVKLVIADEQNFRFDSAVFLEAGSFQLSTNLGPDRLISTQNPLCENETLELNALQTGATNYKWFKDGVEQITETDPTFLVAMPGTYNVEVTLQNNCIAFGQIIIEYGVNPIVSNASLVTCDIDQNGLTIYDLNDAINNITLGDNTLVINGFYLSLNDALQLTNVISDPDSFENTIPNQIVYARVENQFGCFDIAELMLQISNNVLTLLPFTSCDDVSNNGFTTFDLNELRNEIASIVPLNASIQFYENSPDAFSETNALPSNYDNIMADTQTIFVWVNLNDQCFAISTVVLQVLDVPVLEPDITIENPLYYCLNNFPETIVLDAGIVNDSPNNYSYLWSTGETMSFIEVNEPGTYLVTVTGANDCFNSRSIVVTSSNVATIENIIIEDLMSNNTVTIQVSGEGVYEFSIDDINGPYQESPVFENVTAGFHTVYVKDLRGCGIVEEVISVLGFPNFFTPNGDGFNDVWHIKGINANFNPSVNISIFNRYGKLIKFISDFSPGWNGTFNGVSLPSDDYWFLAKFSNGKEYRGHFALVR